MYSAYFNEQERILQEVRRAPDRDTDRTATWSLSTFQGALRRAPGRHVWDNLTGHHTPDFVPWLVAHGIMPLFTALGGSYLNIAESVQRILKRRALDGRHPRTPEEIIAWLEATARGWNREPTPFVWWARGRHGETGNANDVTRLVAQAPTRGDVALVLAGIMRCV